jgi:carboxyl-terminal processing protease
MKKKVNVGFMAGVLVLAVILTFNVTYVLVWHSFSDRIQNLSAREASFSKISEICAYIDEFFIGEYDEKKLLEGISDGYVGALGDFSSYYLTKEEAQALLSGADSGYTGIGIISSYDQDNAGIRILQMPEGSSAQEHGLEVLDCIVAVDGMPVNTVGYESALEMIRGEEGTEVALTVYRQITGERFNVIVRRGAVVTQQAIACRMLDDVTGYIRLDNFDEGVDAAFSAAYADLRNQGMERLVLDLRMNPGGYMEQVCAIADQFLEKGQIIYKERDYSGNVVVHYAAEGAETIDIAVLINEFTAGGAEYFAAALAENGRAKVVGSVSAGVGYAQSSIELSDGSVLVLSTTEYLTAKGNSLQGTGYAPDVEQVMDIDELYEVLTLTDPADRQLDAACAALKNG